MFNKPLIKIFYRVVLSLILMLFLFNIYLYIKQPDMVFYPIKKIEVTPEDWGLAYKAVKLELADKSKISGWYLPHPEANKTVLFFHGNGGNISHRGDSIYIFHKLKVNVFIIDYAGYGESEGTHSEESLYQSANAAWNYLITNKKAEPEKIIIFGRSLGGAVAVDLASKVNAGGLILESTFSSVRDIVGIAFPIMSPFLYLRYSFDSLEKITKINSPILIIHSPDDEVIPFESGVKLFNHATSHKDFLQIRGGHNDGFMQSISPYMQSLWQFFQSV